MIRPDVCLTSNFLCSLTSPSRPVEYSWFAPVCAVLNDSLLQRSIPQVSSGYCLFLLSLNVKNNPFGRSPLRPSSKRDAHNIITCTHHLHTSCYRRLFPRQTSPPSSSEPTMKSSLLKKNSVTPSPSLRLPVYPFTVAF